MFGVQRGRRSVNMRNADEGPETLARAAPRGFVIGAHASLHADRLLALDEERYERCFQKLKTAMASNSAAS
jgi:hypothetical protein